MRVSRSAFAAAAAAALAVPAAADTPDRPQLAAAVKAAHGTTVKRLQDWIARPTIAAEKRGVAEGAAYMRQLALDAGFQQAKIVPTDGVPALQPSMPAPGTA